MRVLLGGLALAGLAFVIHLIVWRIRVPKRQTKTLLQIFFAVLILGLLVLQNTPSALGFSPLDSFAEYLHISLFFISITLAYMITYSALEADSPSLVMIMTIARAGSDGLSKEAFEHSMNDDLLVKPRIRDLILDQMAYLEGDKYRVTVKGALFARIFIFYRKLLNAPKGG